MATPGSENDIAGGDGSDSDLYEIMESAAAAAAEAMRSFASNPGMEALCDLVEDAIYEMADEMAQEEVGPDFDKLMEPLYQVHSPETAVACMSEAVAVAFDILMDGYDELQAHELEEGG